MEFTEKLKETTDRFYKDVKNIKNLKTYNDVDAAERQCVDCLQALQVLVAESGRDLYAAVQERRKQLSVEAINPIVVEKPVKKVTRRRGKNSK